MAHDHKKVSYLSDKETVDKVYGLIKSGEIDAVVAYFKGLGEDKVLIPKWIHVQCDINNVCHDPMASSQMSLPGIEYCISKGYKVQAAMMLHNTSAFFMPDFDENVDPEGAKIALAAARKQLPIRRDLGDAGPLMWSMWDLGLAELVVGNADEAIKILSEGEALAFKSDDKDGAAWCKIFIGKAKFLHKTDLKDEWLQDMKDAGNVILEFGADWEKKAVSQIWKAVRIES